MFDLSVGFLDSNDVVVMGDFLNGFFLAFLRASGRPSAVRRPLAFHVANESVVASFGNIRLASSLLAGNCWEFWRLVRFLRASASLLRVVSV